jgi:hypothetical protein
MAGSAFATVGAKAKPNAMMNNFLHMILIVLMILLTAASVPGLGS